MAKKFKPFEHDDLELKNQLIDYARKIKDTDTMEAQLGCAMIYASFAEYMAGHLLDNLRHLMYQSTYRDFAALLFVDQRPKKSDKPLTMGGTVGRLKTYGFPDKEAILELLASIGNSRNNLFHNFAKSDVKGFEVLTADIESIKEDSEELFEKINTLYIALRKVLLPAEQGESIES